MINNVLEKLSPEQLEYCEILSHNIRVAWWGRSIQGLNTYCGKLKGFLDCLHISGAINPWEERLLFEYYKRYKKE